MAIRSNAAAIEWNGDLWVAKFNGVRYADCNNKRLTERLYDAGASVVFEEFSMPQPRKTLVDRTSGIRHKLKL